MVEIKTKSDCSGCSACAQRCPKHCITMTEDSEGFLYPVVDTKYCIDCNLCESVCQYRTPVKIVEPIISLAAFSTDEEIRKQSSSGGIFSVLAENVIDQGGVVFGARFDTEWNVILDYVETVDGLSLFRGSKYVQAVVGDTYRTCEQFLQSGRIVLFSGTPCQIAGLKLFLRKDYDNLFTIDVVCHGVPSPMVWQHYLHELLQKKSFSTCKAISFRNKNNGWKQYNFSLTDTQTEFNECHRENLYMKAFLSDLILRPSCYECQFRGTNRRQSDISIADYWGIEHDMPKFDDDRGVSLVMINTEKGNIFFPFYSVNYNITNLKYAQGCNGGLYNNKLKNRRRRLFFFCAERATDILNLFTIFTMDYCDIYKQIRFRCRRFLCAIIRR